VHNAFVKVIFNGKYIKIIFLNFFLFLISAYQNNKKKTTKHQFDVFLDDLKITLKSGLN